MSSTRYSRIQTDPPLLAIANNELQSAEGDTGGQPDNTHPELAGSHRDSSKSLASTVSTSESSDDEETSGSEEEEPETEADVPGRLSLTADQRDKLIKRRNRRIEDLRSKVKDASAQIAGWKGKIQGELEEVKKLETEIEAEREKSDNIPTGPPELQWVNGKVFNLISSMVVISNIGLMFHQVGMHQNGETTDPEHERLVWWLNQIFLIFYIVELVLRRLLFEREFFWGDFKDVWWNWLDAFIVVGGILDEWIFPMLEWIGLIHVRGTALPYFLKGLRFLRIARILKVVRNFLKSDLSWAEGDKFKVFMMGVIALNCIVMGIETDWDQFPGWPYVDNMFLLIYVFELTVRIRHARCEFFRGPKEEGESCCQSVTCGPQVADLVWNYLDFVIVLGGVIDQWLLPFTSLIMSLIYNTNMKAGLGSQSGQIMMLLRMARLLRLLRLVRLIRKIPDLYKLVVGIIQAMQGMCWVLVLTFVLLYCFGLLCVKLFGPTHGLAWGGADFVPEPYRDSPDAAFTNLPSAMWVLFMTMNGDPGGLEALFEVLPWTKLLCAIFMVISSWAILSILTAVVSENMINATERTEEEQQSSQTKHDRKLMRKRLRRVFKKIDENQSGYITESEFTIAKTDHRSAICKAIKGMYYDPPKSLEDESKEKDKEEKGLRKLEEIFTLLLKLKGVSRDDELAVKREDFIKGMQCEDENPNRKEVLQLQAKIVDSVDHMRSEQGLLKDIELRLEDTIQKKLGELEQSLHERLFGRQRSEPSDVASSCADIVSAIGQALERSPTLMQVKASIDVLANFSGMDANGLQRKFARGSTTDATNAANEQQDASGNLGEDEDSDNNEKDSDDAAEGVPVHPSGDEVPPTSSSCVVFEELVAESGSTPVTTALEEMQDEGVASEHAPVSQSPWPAAVAAAATLQARAACSEAQAPPQLETLASAASTSSSSGSRGFPLQEREPPPAAAAGGGGGLLTPRQRLRPQSKSSPNQVSDGQQPPPLQQQQRASFGSAAAASSSSPQPSQSSLASPLQAPLWQPHQSKDRTPSSQDRRELRRADLRTYAGSKEDSFTDGIEEGMSRLRQQLQASAARASKRSVSSGSDERSRSAGLGMCCVDPEEGSVVRSSREITLPPVVIRESFCPEGGITGDDVVLPDAPLLSTSVPSMPVSSSSLLSRAGTTSAPSRPKVLANGSGDGAAQSSSLLMSQDRRRTGEFSSSSTLGSIKETKRAIAANLQQSGPSAPLLTFQDLEQQRFQDSDFQDLEQFGATRVGSRIGWTAPSLSESSASQATTSRSVSQQLSPRTRGLS